MRINKAVYILLFIINLYFIMTFTIFISSCLHVDEQPRRRIVRTTPEPKAEKLQRGIDEQAISRIKYVQTNDLLEKLKGKSSFTHSHSTSFILNPVYNISLLSCSLSEKVNWTMVTFIKSAAGNFNRRSLIRKSWGNIRYTKSGRFIYVFVIGRHNSNASFLLIWEEAKLCNDILLFDGPDEYKNIVSKTLAGMQWALENLPNTSDYLYSSADDDMLINHFTFQRIINKYMETGNGQEKWPPSFPIICAFRLAILLVNRDEKDKNFIPYHEYPSTTYPRACLGGFYTTSMPVLSRLWKSSHNEQALSNTDDVWVTGVLRKKAGLPDDAVVKPYKQAADHFKGNITEMEKYWKYFYEQIAQEPHCVYM